MAYYQGKFRPKNPSKYKGNPTNIQYRSGWELKLMNYLDTHPEVIQWSSEEVVIPYKSPVDRRIHRYFPDFVYTSVRNGKRDTVMVEIKPYAQTVPPALAEGKKVDRRYKTKVITYGINDAKWRAAREFCADRGWQFRIMTEYDLGIR
jgi:hypothetical protein